MFIFVHNFWSLKLKFHKARIKHKNNKSMKIAIVGSGYVGLVSGVCFSEMGVEVVCIDKDSDKIEKLRKGQVPIYEPELDTLIRKNLSAGRVSFETDLK